MENQNGARWAMTIAEAIEASRGTEHVPVTFESSEHVEGPFFHGTSVSFEPGDQLVPGHGSNYHDGRVSNHVYFSALVEPAIWGASSPLLSRRTTAAGTSMSLSRRAPSKTIPT